MLDIFSARCDISPFVEQLGYIKNYLRKFGGKGYQKLSAVTLRIFVWHLQEGIKKHKNGQKL
jgi:hypothetical protein